MRFQQMQQGIDMDLWENIDNRREGFVKCTINGVHFLGCYLPPSLTIEAYRRRLHDIVSDARHFKPVVIAGDVNAWAVEWGSAYTNKEASVYLALLQLWRSSYLSVGRLTHFRETDGVLRLT